MDEELWSLYDNGDSEIKEYQERAEKIAREQAVKDILSSPIISEGDGGVVKVKLPILKDHKFVWGKNEGTPEADEVKTGETEAPEGWEYYKNNDSGEEGTEPGEGNESHDYVTVEIPISDIVDHLAKELGLPNLEEKAVRKIEEWETNFDTYRETDTFDGCDVEETLLKNLIRNMSAGNPGIGGFIEDDYVKLSYNERQKESTQACVYFLMDVSGSMSDAKKAIAKMFFFWTKIWLKKCYSKVDVVFIAHDEKAWIETEKKFFSVQSGGGTYASSAIELCKKDVTENHPSSQWNNYILHVSDGDVFRSDAEEYLKVLLSMDFNLFGYIETPTSIDYEAGGFAWGPRNQESEWMQVIKKVKHPRILASCLDKREKVGQALKDIFGRA